MPIARRVLNTAGALAGRAARRFIGRGRMQFEPDYSRRQRAEEAGERDPKRVGEKMPEISEKFAGDLFTGSKITPEARNFFRQCGLSDAEINNLFEFLRKGLYGNEEKQQFVKLMVELRAELPQIMFLLGKWQKYGAKIAPEIGNDYRVLFSRLLRTTPDYARKHLNGWLSALEQLMEQEEMMKKMMGKH